MPLSKRRRTQVSYNIDPYKDIDSDPEALPDANDIDSESDEEFTVYSPGQEKDQSGSEDNGIGEEEEDDDNEEEYEDDQEEGNDQIEEDNSSTPRKVKKSATAYATNPLIRYTRRPGLPAKSNSKRERIESIYGNSYDALVAGIRARDAWITDPVLPKRKNLGYTPFYDDSAFEIVDLGNGEQVVHWQEYGAEKSDIEQHLPSEASIRCILGPLDAQKIITFQRFGICDLATLHTGRSSYMLNAGGQVVGMDWAPNKPTGFQYLAISVKTPAQAEAELSSTEVPPAYARTSGPGHIQIWRVPSDTNKGTIGGKPSLALIISHNWGTTRSVKWCPIPRGVEDPKEIGYLGGIFSDGTCKILRVTLPEEEDVDEATYFAEFTEPLFTGNLGSDGLCTCLAWTSTHEIAVGCSNGFVAVWDIQQAISPENKNTIIPPHHFIPLHQTYILDIQSCIPSYPNTIVTSSMDGHCRLTNLTDPQADSILTGRSRLSSNAVVWVDCIHTVLASEEGTWVKMYPLRRFWSSTSVARQSQGGVIIGLAGSKCHPFVLAGGGEGEVIVFNPLRRTFHGKIKVYQQTWFHIEYSPQSDMYRVIEGFKMENISFKFETRGSKGDGHSTVFEEKGGVTRVCWNPNPEFGGWAAAGTAGGLVRVEDLAI